MEDDELLEREKKRTKYLDFSKCVICQKSNGKKQVTALKLPHCMNLLKLLLLLEQFVQSFLAKHRHPWFKFQRKYPP